MTLRRSSVSRRSPKSSSDTATPTLCFSGTKRRVPKSCLCPTPPRKGSSALLSKRYRTIRLEWPTYCSRV
ncbi:hypothetical protein FF1_034675 [Malus domestica]